MTELNGLAAIINSAGVLHSVEGPPSAPDFASLSEYEAAYDRWWVRMNCWRVTRGIAPSPSPTGL